MFYSTPGSPQSGWPGIFRFGTIQLKLAPVIVPGLNRITGTERSVLSLQERIILMSDLPLPAPQWLSDWFATHSISLWGVADLRDFATPLDEAGEGFPYALSWAVPVNPEIMFTVQRGPNQAYADEYVRVNRLINEVSIALTDEIRNRGFRARSLPASDRTDTVNLGGDFPHKTAATRGGLGWIGRHNQLVTRRFGSWVRLGTVFTDLELPCGPPMEKNFCGSCTRCVEACPAQALTGKAWYPGLPREEMLDVWTCEQWKKEQYLQYNNGHACGICSAVCPHGLKTLK